MSIQEPAPADGALSPDWCLPRLDGGELCLRSLRGRRVLLFFWASW